MNPKSYLFSSAGREFPSACERGRRAGRPAPSPEPFLAMSGFSDKVPAPLPRPRPRPPRCPRLAPPRLRGMSASLPPRMDWRRRVELELEREIYGGSERRGVWLAM